MISELKLKLAPIEPSQARNPVSQMSIPTASNQSIYLPKQELLKPLNQYASLAETFQPRDIGTLLKSAKTQAAVAKSTVETRMAQTDSRRLTWVRFGYELYLKYSYGLVCLVFLFIGAPMGAIIRKGGFGYPILVSISFFVTFLFLNILCQRLAEAFVLPPFWAAMMPCLMLTPIGIFLTRKATNDAPLLDVVRLRRFAVKLGLKPR